LRDQVVETLPEPIPPNKEVIRIESDDANFGRVNELRTGEEILSNNLPVDGVPVIDCARSHVIIEEFYLPQVLDPAGISALVAKFLGHIIVNER
jgi:hypothetical protein